MEHLNLLKNLEPILSDFIITVTPCKQKNVALDHACLTKVVINSKDLSSYRIFPYKHPSPNKHPLPFLDKRKQEYAYFATCFKFFFFCSQLNNPLSKM